MPSQANLNRLLGSNFALLSPYNIHKDLLDQLRVVHLYNSLSKTLYENVSDTSGLPLETHRVNSYNCAKTLYTELMKTLGSVIPSKQNYHKRLEVYLQKAVNTKIMLLAANVQLHGFAFFLPPDSSARETGFIDLYDAACNFIREVMDFETQTGTLLERCTNIIVQSFFSATLVLLKLLHSSFTESINTEHGKALFNAAILAVRRMSLRSDDVCARMAIRVPQTAKDMSPGGIWSSAQYDHLELKIKARMCANHTYDCMWHWLTARRQEAQIRGTVANPALVQDSLPDTQAQVDLSHARLPNLTATTSLIGDGFDMFNSMDWFLGDFTCGLYEFST